MTFIFDAGISGQVTNFEENGVKKNANNQILSMWLQAFRLAATCRYELRYHPFTNVGYNYSASEWVNC